MVKGHIKKGKNEFGSPLRLPPYRGRISPAYNHLLFLEAVSDCHRLLSQPKTQLLLDGRNRVGAVSLPRQDGIWKDIVIKEFSSVGVNKLKSAFLKGKAFKSWRGSAALVERGIETPHPVAFLEWRKGLFLEQSFFLSEKLSDVEEIRFLFQKLPPPEMRELLFSLGQYLSCCHNQGIIHRDLSDGNILVKRESGGQFKFYLIDTNRIRLMRHVRLWRRIKNLIRLGIPDNFQHYFLEQYTGKTRLGKFVWLWYRLNKMTYTHYVRLKKKLKLRRLSRKLKIQ